MYLYDHQLDALERLDNGKILKGSVGSGKSLVSLAYFCTKICDGNLDPFEPITHGIDLYIITTARKRDRYEWDKELNHFCLKRSDNPDKVNGIRVIVDSWNNIGKYRDVCYAFFIFDEDHVVGSGSWSKTFIALTRKNSWIMLSATPGDKWEDYIAVFIANGFYKNRTDFARKHLIISQFGGYPKIIGYLDEHILREYKRRILVYMDYKNDRKKKDHRILCEYDEKLYKKILKTRFNPWKNEPYKQISDVIYGLRRATNESDDRIFQVFKLVSEYKKVIIFYNFNYELYAIKEMLDSYNIIHAEYNGKVHDNIPDTDIWVFLVQYTAGSEGWNCIETNVIIFFSQTYSYKQLIQAKGRIDRINSPFYELHYYHLISNAQIDHAIHRALIKKQDFNQKDFIKEIDDGRDEKETS